MTDQQVTTLHYWLFNQPGRTLEQKRADLRARFDIDDLAELLAGVLLAPEVLIEFGVLS